MNESKARTLATLVAKGKIPKLIVSSHDMHVFKGFMNRAKKTKLVKYPNGAGEIVLA